MPPVWKLLWFSGRARRREYWIVTVLANAGQIIPLVLIFRWASQYGGQVADRKETGPINIAVGLISVAALLLNLAVSARRLHDRGKSAAWLLLFYLAPIVTVQLVGNRAGPEEDLTLYRLALVPVLGVFVWGLIEFGVLPGDVGPNRFGPDPRGRVPADIFE